MQDHNLTFYQMQSPWIILVYFINDKLLNNSGGLLWTRYWTCGFHKMLGGSWGAAQLTAPQEGFSSISK
jgi:hypothetical protein